MNSSQFMDKQILGLSGSHQNNDFLELMNPSDEQNGGKKEEILPSYDFQPIRPVGDSQSINLDRNVPSGSRVWSSAESKSTSTVRNFGSIEPSEPLKVKERDRDAYDMATVSEIDRTMKKHADNLLCALEGVSTRLSQLESRTRHLESSVDELKVSVGNNHGSNDGRLRQVENVLREVQTAVQVLRDKQEIAEAHVQLVKLQVSKGDQPTENNTAQTATIQPTVPPPTQPLQAPLPPPQLPSLPPPNAPLPPQPQNSSSMPLSQLPRDTYFPPPGQQPEAQRQQYSLPAQQTAPPPQHYQSPPQLPQYSQPAPQPQQHQPPPLGPVNPSQPQPPLNLPPPPTHHPEEASYMPPLQSYMAGPRQPASLPQQSSGTQPSQQFYGPTAQMYEPSTFRPGSGQYPFSGGYGLPSGPNFGESYSYSGPLPSYTSSAMKPPQLSPSAPTGGSSYPRLPTAHVLPQAIPTASSASSGGPGPGTGNRVPIDDVVDKVTSMGFPRDVVRATVRKLTENGQSVDLNVVLDKLMNDGEIQPPKGWFGR